MRSSSTTHARAKKLRRTLSPPEALLWIRLRKRSQDLPAFRRQHPIGPYVADFYCAATKLVIEVDGSDHGTEERIERDEVRDRYMQKLGYRIVRLTAAEVMAGADDAADGVIQAALALISEDRERRLCAPSITAQERRGPPPP